MTDPPAQVSVASTNGQATTTATTTTATTTRSRGYGRSGRWDHLIFDGNEKNYEIWEVKMLSYMLLRGLKDVIDPSDPSDELTGDDIVLNEEAFAELVQFFAMQKIMVGKL